MTPVRGGLVLLFALITYVNSANSANESYQKANKEYKEAFFSYLSKKTSAAQLKIDYANSLQEIKAAEASVVTTSQALQKAETLLVQSKSQLDRENQNYQQQKTILAEIEALAKQELDSPTNEKVLSQLNQQSAKHRKTLKSYLSDIQVVVRQVDRVKASPKYRRYVDEIAIRKKRLNNLKIEEESAQVELSNIKSEIARLNTLLQNHIDRFEEAVQILPSLQQEIDVANTELDAAQQSGNHRRIQVAESNLNQALSNYRRYEVQRNEAERGKVETTAILEKKENLKSEKEKLLVLIAKEKEQTRKEWEELYASYQRYHKDNLEKHETRLAELKKNKSEVEERINKIEEFVFKIERQQAAVKAFEKSVKSHQAKVQKDSQAVSMAKAAIEKAKKSVTQAQQKSQSLKDSHNQTVAQIETSYQTAIEKQKVNEAARKQAGTPASQQAFQTSTSEGGLL